MARPMRASPTSSARTLEILTSDYFLKGKIIDKLLEIPLLSPPYRVPIHKFTRDGDKIAHTGQALF